MSSKRPRPTLKTSGASGMRTWMRGNRRPPAAPLRRCSKRASLPWWLQQRPTAVELHLSGSFATSSCTALRHPRTSHLPTRSTLALHSISRPPSWRTGLLFGLILRTLYTPRIAVCLRLHTHVTGGITHRFRPCRILQDEGVRLASASGTSFCLYIFIFLSLQLRQCRDIRCSNVRAKSNGSQLSMRDEIYEPDGKARAAEDTPRRC